MALFALVVSIIGVVVAAVGAYFAKRSADAADASRIAAETSAQAATDQATATREQADAAKRQLTIENERLHGERTPVLRGHVIELGSPTRPGIKSHQLVVEVVTSRPLATVTLTLPQDSPVGVMRGVLGMRHDLFYPEPGRPSVPIQPGRPATWAVQMTGSPVRTVTAVASCRDEYGEQWTGIEVEIDMPDTPGPH